MDSDNADFHKLVDDVFLAALRFAGSQSTRRAIEAVAMAAQCKLEAIEYASLELGDAGTAITEAALQLLYATHELIQQRQIDCRDLYIRDLLDMLQDLGDDSR